MYDLLVETRHLKVKTFCQHHSSSKLMNFYKSWHILTKQVYNAICGTSQKLTKITTNEKNFISNADDSYLTSWIFLWTGLKIM